MSKISFDVEKENVQLVMTLLENLKEGLVHNLKVDDKQQVKHKRYEAKQNKIVMENEPVQGKYIDVNAFKNRLRKKKTTYED